MRLQELARSLNLRELTPAADATVGNGASDITQGYASDLLSDVLAHAPVGGILVTLQVQPNVIAVASMAGLRAVIFSCNRVPDSQDIERAAAEDLSLYVASADTFDVVGLLYSLGIRSSTASGRRWKGNECERPAGGHKVRTERDPSRRRPPLAPLPWPEAVT
jgi:hypothetical protein